MPPLDCIESKGPKRWAVPRPGPDGEPIGVLRIEVVPATAYDNLAAELRRVNEMAKDRDDVIFQVTKLLRDAYEVLNAYEDRTHALASGQEKP